jgi:hypothetical protein
MSLSPARSIIERISPCLNRSNAFVRVEYRLSLQYALRGRPDTSKPIFSISNAARPNVSIHPRLINCYRLVGHENTG